MTAQGVWPRTKCIWVWACAGGGEGGLGGNFRQMSSCQMVNDLTVMPHTNRSASDVNISWAEGSTWGLGPF